MKPQTRDTVLMILRADPTVTQQLMQSILVAMDGGTLEEVVSLADAMRVLRCSRRQVFYMAKVGKLRRVMGIGSRGIGFTRASLTGCALAISLENANQS